MHPFVKVYPYIVILSVHLLTSSNKYTDAAIKIKVSLLASMPLLRIRSISDSTLTLI